MARSEFDFSVEYKCDRCGHLSVVAAEEHRQRLCFRTNCGGTQAPTGVYHVPATNESDYGRTNYRPEANEPRKGVSMRSVPGGVRLEVDGQEVKNLISVSVTCRAGEVAEVMARTYPTEPLDFQFDEARVTIVRMDVEALDLLAEAMRVILPFPENLPLQRRIDDLFYRAGHGGTKMKG